MPDLDAEIEKRLKHLKCLFTADCVFLENNRGPCIFPADIRPEICITSFCTETPNASRQIGAVKWNFQKLAWFVRMRRTRDFFQGQAIAVKSARFSSAFFILYPPILDDLVINPEHRHSGERRSPDIVRSNAGNLVMAVYDFILFNMLTACCIKY